MKESTNNLPEFTFESMPRTIAKVYDAMVALQNEIAVLKQSFQPKEPVEFMTRKEVSEMLLCDESTVHNWTIKKKLVKYCIGNRTYYKRSEVLAAVIAIK